MIQEDTLPVLSMNLYKKNPEGAPPAKGKCSPREQCRGAAVMDSHTACLGDPGQAVVVCSYSYRRPQSSAAYRCKLCLTTDMPGCVFAASMNCSVKGPGAAEQCLLAWMDLFLPDKQGRAALEPPKTPAQLLSLATWLRP